MKIYEFFWDSSGYGSGVMLILANSSEEARECIFDSSSMGSWELECERTDIQYTGKSEEPKVLLEMKYQE